MDRDWDVLVKLFKVYPEHFDLSVCNHQMYIRCASFISTRCFGWGLPTTIVAPMADSFNHQAITGNQIDIVHKKLHLQQNKIYHMHFNFDIDSATPDAPMYDENTSKLSYNLEGLYKGMELTAEESELIKGQPMEPDEDAYDDKEVYDRFVKLFRYEEGRPPEEDDDDVTGEIKKSRTGSQNHGIEIWGLGYVSSDCEQDDDEQDEEESGEVAAENERLKRKILSGPDVAFTADEFDTISYDTRLREIF